MEAFLLVYIPKKRINSILEQPISVAASLNVAFYKISRLLSIV